MSKTPEQTILELEAKVKLLEKQKTWSVYICCDGLIESVYLLYLNYGKEIRE